MVHAASPDHFRDNWLLYCGVYKIQDKRREDMSANAPEPTTTTWNIDPAHTTAEFKVRHMMITNVKGHFTGVTGVLTLDEQDITKSHVEASVDAASINTREADRDI